MLCFWHVYPPQHAEHCTEYYACYVQLCWGLQAKLHMLLSTLLMALVLCVPTTQNVVALSCHLVFAVFSGFYPLPLQCCEHMKQSSAC